MYGCHAPVRFGSIWGRLGQLSVSYKSFISQVSVSYRCSLLGLLICCQQTVTLLICWPADRYSSYLLVSRPLLFVQRLRSHSEASPRSLRTMMEARDQSRMSRDQSRMSRTGVCHVLEYVTCRRACQCANRHNAALQSSVQVTCRYMSCRSESLHVAMRQ